VKRSFLRIFVLLFKNSYTFLKNKSLFLKKAKSMFYKRKIYSELFNHLYKKQITVLTGMRRTGKTTLIKHLFSEIKSKNKIYLDLERVDNRHLFTEENYDNIIHALSGRGLNLKEKMYIAIDEIQYLPKIASVMKYLYDNYDIKFLATGSSSFYLKNLFSESLSGRKKIYELFPLDFGEYLTFKEISFGNNDYLNKKFNIYEYERLHKHYFDYIEYGGFPEVTLEESVNGKKDLINDILSSYINIDIKTIADFETDRDIYSILRLLGTRTGNRIDYSKLSKLCGISRYRLLNYIDFFEKTYIIKRLPVNSNNPDTEISKAQKLYIMDNGIANILADLGSGAKFENAIFNQLFHKGKLTYYSLKTGREIDFIIDKKNSFEAKETPSENDLKKLIHLSKKAGINNSRVIGKYPVPGFINYIWGGDIK